MKSNACKYFLVWVFWWVTCLPLAAQNVNQVDTATFRLESTSHSGVSAMANKSLSLTFTIALEVSTVKDIVITQGGSYNEPIGARYSVVKGKWSYSNSNKTIVFTPTIGFQPGMLICVTIPSSVKSFTGIAFQHGKDMLHFIIDNGINYGHEADSVTTIKVIDGNNLPLIISTPQNAEKHPVLIFVHGGAWKGGMPSESIAMLPLGYSADYLVNKLGIALVGVAYRCIGSNGNFTKALSDIKDAVQYVKEHAATYHLDLNRIGICGESAGSPLAALVAQQDAAIKCFVGWNGMYDFVNDGNGKFGTGNSFGQETPTAAANSAIFNIRPVPANTLLIHGNADNVISYLQSVNFNKAINKAGGQSKLLIYDGEPHWYFYAPGGKYEISTLYQVKEYLIKNLK